MLTERDLENPDPLRLNREIALAAENLLAHRRRLRQGEGWDGDPFMTTRMVAGKSAFLAIRGLPDADPLKTPLTRWVYRLADARINQVAIVRMEAEYRLTEHVVSEPERARLPLSALMARGLASAKRRDAWLGSFVASSEPMGTAVAAFWERRLEVTARLNLSDTTVIEGVGADIGGAARSWLSRTRDAFFETTKPGLSGLVSVALAEGAPEGWPRHLLPRTILDFFRNTDLFRSVDLNPGPLPAALGPASFLRALARVGAAFVDATAPIDQPFVVAHDPYGLRRRTMGALLGTLPASPAFARHALGVDASRLVDHGRALSASLLVESRVAALRVLLRGPALAGRRALREAFEAEVHDALGLTLPATAAGAIFRLHHDDAQRFAGLLLAATKSVALRDANDEDWYRNPRTVEQLRDEARLSPECDATDEALESGARAFDATLTRAL